MSSGMIFDIRRYSINDGPGIRVTVFFKGCPLHCEWCHNPESISTRVEKMYNADKCIGCRSCVEVCLENACTLTTAGIVTDRDICTGCGECAEICPTKATEMSGRLVTVKEIIEIVEKERVFFDQSAGGVTLSGGEPLLQPKFLIALLDELGSRSIHRIVDTSGFASPEILLEVAKRTDHFLYDLKITDPKYHRKLTGVDNEKILRNLEILAATGASINIRIPIIKGANDDLDNIDQTASFVASLSGEKKVINLLPYHDIMSSKYQKLGTVFNPGSMSEPSSDELKCIIERFAKYELTAILGG